MPFSTKVHSSCSKSYKIEYKATVTVFVIIVCNSPTTIVPILGLDLHFSCNIHFVQ